MIVSFATQGTEDLFNGRNTKAARKICPRSLWPVSMRKLDQLDSVRTIAGDEHMAHVVLAIAHGMTGVHDRVSPRETAMIERIAEALGVSPEIGDSVIALTAHRRVSRRLLHTAKDTVRKHTPRRYTKGQKP